MHYITLPELSEILLLERKESPLDYRREYQVRLLVKNPQGQLEEKNVDFVLEMNPLGEEVFRVLQWSSFDYPVASLLKALRTEILQRQTLGVLP